MAGRPVLSLSLALNYRISGLKVQGYHAVNLAVHILAGLTLLGIVRRTLLSERLAKRFGRASFSLALVCALIWLVHPLQTQSVTYIVQRAESLVGLFYLLTLYCAIRGASAAKSRGWYASAIAVCALGMATKEVMATAPVMVLLYDRVFLARSFKEVFSKRRGLYAGLACTWIIFGILALTAPRGSSVGFDFAEVSSLEYAMTQCKAIVWYYLKLSFWPDPLVFDYGQPIVRNFVEIVPHVLVLAVLFAGTVAAFRYHPSLGFLGAWFFLILAPSSSFVPIVTEIAAEHRMYLPLAAVITIVVVCGYALGKGVLVRLAISDKRRLALGCLIGYGLAGAAVVTLGVLTVRRNCDYGSELSIWDDTIAKRPENWRGHHNRGMAHRAKEQYELAVLDFSEAIRLHPEYARAYSNRGLTYLRQRKYALAISDFGQAIGIDPEYAEPYNNRGVAYWEKGDSDKAIRDFSRVIQLNHGHVRAYYNRGVGYKNKGEYDLAISDFSEVIRLSPGHAMAYYNRGDTYRMKGQYEQAKSDLDMAAWLHSRLRK